MSNAEIADTLEVAHATVKVHTNRIYQKMDVKNRTQAAIKAQYIGIGPLAHR
jgi:ATP/maltotriose-dependent transcriptional regulator MalT